MRSARTGPVSASNPRQGGHGVYFRLLSGLSDCMTQPSLRCSLRLALAAGTFALTLGIVSPTVLAGPQNGLKASDARTIHHVLNRLGFGARPGDVERVRSMGLEAYIESQLQPERVDDSALEARLASFQTLTMSTADLAEQYFRPAMRIGYASKFKG